MKNIIMISTSTAIMSAAFRMGEGETDITETPEFKAALSSATSGIQDQITAGIESGLASATGGLKAKNEELLGKLAKSTEASKAFEGMDAEKVKIMMSAFEKNEDMQLIADGKFEEVIAKRTDSITAKFQEAIDDLTERLGVSEGNESKFRKKLNDNTIKDSISRIALESGVRPEALSDTVRRGLDIFSIDDKGEIEARDSSGQLVQVDGKLQTPERFVESLKKSSPHYWSGSTSGGATGNKGGDQSGSVSKDNSSLVSVVGESGKFSLSDYRAQREQNSGKEYHGRK